jgi:peptidoglycan/xylan/chitin deacetylase (PgdA/CDA1 family)
MSPSGSADGTALDPRIDVLAMILSLLVAAATAPASSSDPHIVILAYHEVEPDGVPPHETVPRGTAAAKTTDEMQRYTASTEAFGQQLDALASHGYTVISVEVLSDFVNGNRATLPARSAVITVDDGWRSVKTTMAPELAKRGLPFTAFVYPRVIDGHARHPFNLAWEDVAALSNDGVDLQSHALTHPFLSRARHAELSDDGYAPWLEHELRESRECIAWRTGREVRFLAYPYGDYDDGVIAAARAAGYEAAFTTGRGPASRTSNPLALPRYLIHNDTTIAEFESWLK